MNRQLDQASLKERFHHLLKVMSSEGFLNKSGLGKEVPFFICPFKPAEAVEMVDLQKNLVKNLHQTGIHVLEINLYDLSVELLKKRNLWQRTLEIEPTVPKDRLLEMLQSVLDTEHHLVPAMAAKMKDREFQVIFISGVGEVFPFIRSHNVLNNLQTTAGDYPLVMFFPGGYNYSPRDGSSLDLFDILRNDKYYRAFNIWHYEI